MVQTVCVKSFLKAWGRSAHWMQGPPDHGVFTTKTLNQCVLSWEGLQGARAFGSASGDCAQCVFVHAAICVHVSLSHKRHPYLLILV